MKYHVIRQYSEEDCGAACLATIAKHYNRIFSINRVREAVGTGQLGTTLLGLRQGAEVLGFNARSVRASEDILRQMTDAPLPAIIHWKGNHWVVLHGKRRKKYIIADPASDLRYLSEKELRSGWTNWVMLLLEPDSLRFYEQPDDNIKGFGSFVRRAWPYRRTLLVALLYVQAIGLLSLAQPFLIQILTDDVLVRGDTQMLNTVVIAVVVMIVVSGVLQLFSNRLIAHFAQRLKLGLIMEFARQMLHLPLTFYETRRSGEIVSRLADIDVINRLISQVIVGLPSLFVVATVSFVFMLFYSVKLTLFAIVMATLMTSSTFILLPALKHKVRKILVLGAENEGVLVETFKGSLTLKVTGAAPTFWQEFQSRFGHYAHVTYSTMQIRIINGVFSGMVSRIGAVLVLWIGSRLVIAKELSLGQLFAFTAMNANFLAFTATLVGFVDQFTEVRAATQRFTEIIEATPEDQGHEKKPVAVIPSHTDIVCTEVNFQYPGRTELLKDFCLEIPGGRTTAVIGKSGCGKSTLAKLLAGLYVPQSGNIRFSLYNLADLSLDCVRRQVALVPQDAHFWSRSIIDNFRLGAPYLTFEQIVHACETVGADDFIRKMPDKYQSVLGEFGANISGGQRQRLAIARAMAMEPAVLILDESTSGLDPVSEREVLQRVMRDRQEQTTILISHRPSVIVRCDWVVVLDEGKVKHQGRIEDLRVTPGDHLAFLRADATVTSDYEVIDR
jgi:ATP-binding cassette subfamily C protein